MVRAYAGCTGKLQIFLKSAGLHEFFGGVGWFGVVLFGGESLLKRMPQL